MLVSGGCDILYGRERLSEPTVRRGVREAFVIPSSIARLLMPNPRAPIAHPIARIYFFSMGPYFGGRGSVDGSPWPWTQVLGGVFSTWGQASIAPHPRLGMT